MLNSHSRRESDRLSLYIYHFHASDTESSKWFFKCKIVFFDRKTSSGFSQFFTDVPLPAVK